MWTIIALLVVASVSYYCFTYGMWAREHRYYRGFIGIIIVSIITLVLPVGVWVYHNYIR